MNKIIVTGTETGTKFRINLAFIISYYSAEEGVTTIDTTQEDKTYGVKESPEEIDTLIEEATLGQYSIVQLENLITNITRLKW